MSQKRKYHGWIFREDGRGMKDYFSVSFKEEITGTPTVRSMGQGEKGAAAAVRFFEEELGRIKLEDTPLELRVFTEVE